MNKQKNQKKFNELRKLFDDIEDKFDEITLNDFIKSLQKLAHYDDYGNKTIEEIDILLKSDNQQSEKDK